MDRCRYIDRDKERENERKWNALCRVKTMEMGEKNDGDIHAKNEIIHTLKYIGPNIYSSKSNYE